MSDLTPIPVVPQGFGWTAAGAWGTFIVLLTLLVKQILPWRKMSISAGEKMREELNERLKASEEKREKDRTEFDAKIKEIEDARKEERDAREEERVQHENEMRILRHRLNGSDHAIDMLLALLEANPDKVLETVEKIKEIRAEQAKVVAIEKGYVMAAREAQP